MPAIDLRKFLTVALVTSFSMLILFFRAEHAFTNPQFYAEDGFAFFSQQKLFGASAILLEGAGYLHIIPRLVAFFASPLPSEYAPAIYVYSSLMLVGWTAATIATCNIRLSWLYGCLLVLAPHTGECFGNITNLQWIMSVALPFIATSDAPASRTGRINQIIFVALMSLTGPFVTFAAPLFLWRARTDRSASASILAALCVMGACVQIAIAIYAQYSFPPEGPLDTPYLLYAIFERTFGMMNGNYGYDAVHLGFAVLVACTSLSVLILKDERRLFVALWYFALVVIAGAFLRTYQRPHSFDSIFLWDRYFYYGRFVILASLATIALRATAAHRAVAIVTLLLMILFRYNIWAVSSNNWWFKEPMPLLPWTDFARAVDRGEAIETPINPHGWYLSLPARR